MLSTPVHKAVFSTVGGHKLFELDDDSGYFSDPPSEPLPVEVTCGFLGIGLSVLGCTEEHFLAVDTALNRVREAVLFFAESYNPHPTGAAQNEVNRRYMQMCAALLADVVCQYVPNLRVPLPVVLPSGLFDTLKHNNLLLELLPFQKPAYVKDSRCYSLLRNEMRDSIYKDMPTEKDPTGEETTDEESADEASTDGFGGYLRRQGPHVHSDGNKVYMASESNIVYYPVHPLYGNDIPQGV